MNLDIGFIILRYVNSELTNKYWINCYNSIRKYYPENTILIIDDNSDYQYITDEIFYKTTIFPLRNRFLMIACYLQYLS